MLGQHFNFFLISDKKFQFKLKKFKKKKNFIVLKIEKKILKQLFQFFLNFFKKQTLN